MTGEPSPSSDRRAPLRRLRSALYTPGDRPRAIDKACRLGADALILDLEDAVAPDRKPAARAAAPDAIAAFRAAGRYSVLRIHAPGDAQTLLDLSCAAAARPDAVLAAKAEDAGALADLRAALSGAGWSGPLWLMIETPRGMFLAEHLATAPGLAGALGVAVLVAGGNDLALGLRLPDGPHRRAALTPHLARLVLAARAADLGVLDGVYNAHTDEAGFAGEAREARTLGFDGKTLIHPAQIAPCHAAFRPDDGEIAQARAIVAAFADPAHAQRGAIAVNGVMAERLHLDAARATLAAAGLDDNE
ncbi:MAG: CoA ester lyase [Alphaproteobacteria bacterium]|nr:CoA ester lyase [Alphaproteobacteria bacterium]